MTHLPGVHAQARHSCLVVIVLLYNAARPEVPQCYCAVGAASSQTVSTFCKRQGQQASIAVIKAANALPAHSAHAAVVPWPQADECTALRAGADSLGDKVPEFEAAIVAG